MKDEANNNGINAISEIPNGKDSKFLNRKAIEHLLEKIKQNESITEAEHQMITGDLNTVITTSENNNSHYVITF